MEKIIISCLDSRVENNRSIYARFLLGPFKDDQAVTIATALRRSLLSQVKSIAITAIHIQGVTHEFSTIMGVRESVLDLALNFQQVVLRAKSHAQTNRFHENKKNSKVGKASFTPESRLRLERKQRSFVSPREESINANQVVTLHNDINGQTMASKSQARPRLCFTPTKVRVKQDSSSNTFRFGRTASASNMVNQVWLDSDPLHEKAQIGYLQVQGPAVIYANDLKLPVGVECVDPTQYIATLSTEGLLVVKFIIGQKPLSFENHKENVIVNVNEDKQTGYQNIAPIKLLPKRSFIKNSSPIPFEGSQDSVHKSSTLDKQNLLKNESVVNSSILDNSRSAMRYNIENVARAKPEGFACAKQKMLQHAQPTTKAPATAGMFVENVTSFDSTISLRNTLFLDPIFNSVFQVNYLIEKDDLFNQPRERILLELWTNGSIHPRQALHKASLSLISTFSIFRDVFHLDSL